MSRRASITWAATSVPEIRRQWCRALDSSIAHQSTALSEPPAPGHRSVQAGWHRLTAKLAESLAQMRTEVDAIRQADLFWVSRDMVELALDAAQSLPEWTPAIAAPSANGVLCWAKPAGEVPWNALNEDSTVQVTWDGMWWWTRPDGLLQLQPVSRLAKNPELLMPYQVSSPLWVTSPTLMVKPLVPRTAEVAGSTDASPLVSILGAAWLLMGQPAVTETRAIIDSTASRPSATDEGDAASARPTPSVTIVELRRPINTPRDQSTRGSDRQFNRRWWVAGHWRQQACGPNHSQRKPTWVTPYVKGPHDAPLTSDRVHVWKR